MPMEINVKLELLVDMLLHQEPLSCIDARVEGRIRILIASIQV